MVKSLMESLLKKGYNVCTDNFFTTRNLAHYLLDNRATLLGTVRRNCRFLSPMHSLGKPLYESEFLSDSRGVLTTSYQCKKNRNVIVLSTYHKSPVVKTDEKKKPEMIHLYNKMKVGVDAMDNMLRMYSVKAATRRWPVAVFYDMMDKAALNADVLYKEAMGSSISRKKFILELAKSLCAREDVEREQQRRERVNADLPS